MRWSTSRVEAFSDGVIAIAITLLVLEIGVEPAALADPWPALADQWPSYLAYVISFLTVGSVWIAHHGIFARLESVDKTLMRLNIVLLMLVAFLPFPTRVLADSLTQNEAAERAAVVVYGTVVLAIELLLATMGSHVRTLHGGVAPARARGDDERSSGSPPTRWRSSSGCSPSPTWPRSCTSGPRSARSSSRRARAASGWRASRPSNWVGRLPICHTRHRSTRQGRPRHVPLCSTPAMTSSPSTSRRPRFERAEAAAPTSRRDLTDAGDAFAVVRGHDAVVHAAAIPEPTHNPPHVVFPTT